MSRIVSLLATILNLILTVILFAIEASDSIIHTIIELIQENKSKHRILESHLRNCTSYENW